MKVTKKIQQKKVKMMREKRERSEKKKETIVTSNKLKKANILIGAKYKASITELKCTYMAMHNIMLGNYDDLGVGGLIVKITADELSEATGIKKDKLYRKLDKCSTEMMGRLIGITDSKTKSFEKIVFINKTSYKNGVLEIRFPPELKPVLTDIASDFTLIPQKTIMSFKFAYTIKLYEVLKRHCYYPKYYMDEKTYIFNVFKPLDELKFEMGIINPEDEKVKTILLNGKTPDYTAASMRASQKMYRTWERFKSAVLTNALKELNTSVSSNIRVNYTKVRGGRGGKIVGLNFIVVALEDEYGNSIKRTQKEICNVLDKGDEKVDFYYDTSLVQIEQDANCEADNNVIDVDYAELNEYEELVPVIDKKTRKNKELSDDEMFDIILDAADILRELPLEKKLTKKDIKAIVDAAGYDIEKIKTAVNEFNQSKSKISNAIGWLIGNVKNGGYSQNGNNPNYNKNNGLERNYTKEDFQNIEENLLRKTIKL